MARRQRSEPLSPTAAANGPAFVRCGETSIAYDRLGDGGTIALLLQPFWLGIDDVCADETTFGPQLGAGHQVIVHDRRGTGASDRRPGQVGVKIQADDLAAILDDIGVSRVLLVAMSEAAPLAVHFAAGHAERVARLVLVDPQLRPRVGPGSTMLLHTLHSRPRVGLKAFARSLVSDDTAAEMLAARMSERMDAPTAARLYEAFLQADALTVAGSVEARTLLAFGVHDRMVVEEEARALQGHFPNAQIGLVQGTPGTAEAVREAWVQVQDFLMQSGLPDASTESTLPRRSVAPIEPSTKPAAGIDDYVPAGPAPVARADVPAPGANAAQRPVHARWGPPAQVPREAVELNRKAIDQILLGEIETALVLFQQAVEIAPGYKDAQVNYRELLSRLVQRRVAQWQNEQAELVMAEAERRAERYAKRARRSKLPRILRPKQGAA